MKRIAKQHPVDLPWMCNSCGKRCEGYDPLEKYPHCKRHETPTDFKTSLLQIHTSKHGFEVPEKMLNMVGLYLIPIKKYPYFRMGVKS